MPHQDVTKVVKIEIRYNLGTQNAENVVHASYTGSVGLSDLDALETALVTWLDDHWATLASSEWTATEIVITDLDSLSGPRKSYAITPPVEGAILSDALPANATLAVKFGIGTRGRGKSGRLFFIGLAENQVNANTVDGTTGTAIITLYRTLDTVIGAVAPFLGLVIPHLVVGGTRPSPATSSPVASVLLTDLNIDSQKDRLPNHKKHKRTRITP